MCFLCHVSLILTRADLVECINGDHYNGKVMTVDESFVKLQSEITGVLTLPREKVSSIHFGAQPKGIPTVGKTNRIAAPGEILQRVEKEPGATAGESKSSIDPKAIQQVENEFLAGATPEAQAMFRDTVQGFMSGKLSLQDLRGQASSALKQLQDLEKDLGEDDATSLLGGYAGILEIFLKETSPKEAPPSGPTPAQKPAPIGDSGK
jgi:hypothetical protein